MKMTFLSLVLLSGLALADATPMGPTSSQVDKTDFLQCNNGHKWTWNVVPQPEGHWHFVDMDTCEMHLR